MNHQTIHEILRTCAIFPKVRSHPSRLALIDILSDLFGHASKEEIATIIYLVQGRVAPFYAPIEIGMAEKTVAEAVGRAYGSTKEEVLKRYLKVGDLGKVAEMLNQVQHDKKNKLTVKNVLDVLTQIANIKGEGTVEKRIVLLSDLLKKMDAISAKHLVRIPIGNNHLGIGDPTVLDGLALALLGDRTKRKLLEKAYNETSDLGLIGETLKKGGLREVQKLTITVGRPIRSELCERLPNPQKVFEKMSPSTHSINTQGRTEWNRSTTSSGPSGIHATPKYDGFRVQIHKNGDHVTMFSRNLEDMTHMFPEIIEGTLTQVRAKTAILDTEALAYNPDSEEFLPFQETTKRRRKHNIAETAKTLPLKAFVFDILYVDGKSLLETPLGERIEILKKVVVEGDILIPAPGKILQKPEELQLMLDDSISKGLEGVVVKRVDSLYEA
ncbi:MAG: ATP-dependent DNA ligase, partial [Patescibacteria group bacterium]